MRVNVRNGVLSLAVETLGAEAVSLICGGKERLWQNSNGSWAGHAPVLFPVCGHCGVTVNGKSYPVCAHGFAKRKEFKVSERGEDFVELSLASDAETRAVYPYEFVFRVRYTLKVNTLAVRYTVGNPEKEPLYFFCGGHPSFALDGELSNYALEFEKEECFLHLHHDESGYLTGETTDFGSGKVFPLPGEYLQEGRTLIFGGVFSHAVTLRHKSGVSLARVKFEGFPNLLLWRPNGANMICIEPWGNLPDRAGEADPEFSQKKGVVCVPGKGQKTYCFEITYDETE